MKAKKQFKRNKSMLSLFIPLIIILSFTIFVSIYVITNNSSNEQNLNENSNPLKLGNLLQNQNINPSLNLDDSILYHIFDSTSYESRGSSSSSSSSSDNPTEDSLSDLVDINSQSSDDEKENFIDVIVMLKDDEMTGITEKSLSGIKSKVKTKQEEVLSTLNSSEFRIKHKYSTVSGFAGKITQEGLAKLNQDSNVEAIYENELLHITLAQSVPLINADDIHDFGITGNGTVVCVVDTGIDYNHPDLGGCLGDGCKVIDGYDFVDNDEDPMDQNGHGTHVAGIVAANGNRTGVAPDAELLATRVCGPTGCWGDDIIAGVDWCNDKKIEGDYNIVATTMSLSDSGEYNSTTCPIWMDDAINTAHSLGIAVTVASSNEGYSNGISYPACSPSATSVGAVYDANFIGQMSWAACTDETAVVDQITCFTNTGPLLDLLAPGSVIRSTVLNNNYASMSGTSMATPFVAGAIALAKQFLPTASPDEIVDVLKDTGEPITDPDNNLSFPRIDLWAAARSVVECFSNSDCNDSNPNTEDICDNPGTIESNCTYLPITCLIDSDCGTDGYVGYPYCQNNNSWHDYRTFICNNPGESFSFCSYNDTGELKEDCGEDEYSNNYCYGNDLYRDFTDRGCSSGSCFETTTEQLVEECEHGCTEGRCKIEVCNYGKCYYV